MRVLAQLPTVGNGDFYFTSSDSCGGMGKICFTDRIGLLELGFWFRLIPLDGATCIFFIKNNCVERKIFRGKQCVLVWCNLSYRPNWVSWALV